VAGDARACRAAAPSRAGAGRQVFVAMPSDCPTHPDGSQRAVPSGASSASVVLYSSDNEGKDFQQARARSCRTLNLTLTSVVLYSSNNEGKDFQQARAVAGP